MGVGKTTVGKLVATALDMPFVDLDAQIERYTKRSVADLFSSVGELSFRAMEAMVLNDVLDGPPVVLALGGGTLHKKGNAMLLRRCADVVVLEVAWPIVQQRLNHSKERRPLEAKAKRLFQDRASGYRNAGALVNADGSPKQVADRVLAVLP